jgi:HAD superfamily hydrolase (TIGR01509 family)
MENPLKIDEKVLLFDFDGTLVETEILASDVIGAWFQQKGFPEREYFSSLIVGKTWKLAVEEMEREAGRMGFSLGDPEALVSEFKHLYQERCRQGVRLIPGFQEILGELRARARFLGIVTGSEKHEVQTILGKHGILGQFDQIWGFGDYEFSKPHPSPYLTALQASSARAPDTLVFEDSKAGMESAHRAGLQWVQIAHESHAQEPDSRSLLVIPDWRSFKI